MSWLENIWFSVNTVVQAVGSTMSDLVIRLDSITFDSSSPIYSFMGTLRYLVGDTIYVTLVSGIYIGIGFIVYRLIQVVITSITSLIPGLKGKIQFN